MKTAVAAEAFRIPVALDGDGRLLAPDDGRKGAAYRCPSCKGAVDLHAGVKKRRHFHHRPSSCLPETVAHVAAKELIARAVREWVEGVAPAPVFVRRCAHEGCERTCRQPMPRKVGAATLEHRLRSGRVVDVALLARAATQGLPLAAVEVHWSHAVDDDKRGDLPIPWVEVEATQVCENLGRVLVPRQDHLLPWLCAAHASTRGEAARETRETRRAIQALVGSLPYRPRDFPGFHVHALARCPRGHEALVWAWEGDHPPWPRPPHVTATSEDTDVRFDPARAKAGRTLAFRRRYQSVCAVCGAALEE